MKVKSRWIMGTALSVAAIAVAVDHTRHRAPEIVLEEGVSVDDYSAGESPCGLGGSPCALDQSPCSLDSSPCSL